MPRCLRLPAQSGRSPLQHYAIDAVSAFTTVVLAAGNCQADAGGTSDTASATLPPMAQQNNGCAAGCGTLLALVSIALLLAGWQVFLAIGLGLLAVLAYAQTIPGLQQKQRHLKALVEVADLQVRQAPCRLRERFGVVQSITLAGNLVVPQIVISCRTMGSSSNQLQPEEISLKISPPPEPRRLRYATGVADWLKGSSLVLLDDLSVEAKATRAAMECLRELTWASEALGKVGELRTSVIDTLAKASGNELLEPSIPGPIRSQPEGFPAVAGTRHPSSLSRPLMS